ncbi:MAG: hypothetical protein Q9217_001546 [Psora testacea]
MAWEAVNFRGIKISSGRQMLALVSVSAEGLPASSRTLLMKDSGVEQPVLLMIVVWGMHTEYHPAVLVTGRRTMSYTALLTSVTTETPRKLGTWHKVEMSKAQIALGGIISARTAATAAKAAATDPVRRSAPPVKAVGVDEGIPVIIGFVPLPAPAMLLTIKDGHGVDSVMAGIERVIILSGMVVGQEVPQGAETVVYAKTSVSTLNSSIYTL